LINQKTLWKLWKYITESNPQLIASLHAAATRQNDFMRRSAEVLRRFIYSHHEQEAERRKERNGNKQQRHNSNLRMAQNVNIWQQH
jgi:hypothetical protein